MTGGQVQHRGGGRGAAKGDTFRMAAKEGQLDAPPDRRGQRHSALFLPWRPAGAWRQREKQGPADSKGRNKPLLTESTGKAGRVAVFSKPQNTKSVHKNQVYLCTEAMAVETEIEKTLTHTHKVMVLWLELLVYYMRNLCLQHQKHKYRDTCIYKYTHTHMYTHMYKHKYRNICTYKYTHTHVHTHTLPNICVCACKMCMLKTHHKILMKEIKDPRMWRDMPCSMV